VRPILRYTLGAMMAVQASAALTAAAQGTTQTACSLINAEELKRLTELKDILNRGPVPSDPSETPKGVTECEFLGFSFSLTSPMTRTWFDDTRKDQVKSGAKVEPISGVGDDAYYWWDPKPGSLKQVGIAFRAGASRLVIMDMVSSDSIEAAKPMLLKVARYTVPKVR
jgi:hypothetical protein